MLHYCRSSLLQTSGSLFCVRRFSHPSLGTSFITLGFTGSPFCASVVIRISSRSHFPAPLPPVAFSFWTALSLSFSFWFPLRHPNALHPFWPHLLFIRSFLALNPSSPSFFVGVSSFLFSLVIFLICSLHIQFFPFSLYLPSSSRLFHPLYSFSCDRRKSSLFSVILPTLLIASPPSTSSAKNKRPSDQIHFCVAAHDCRRLGYPLTIRRPNITRAVQSLLYLANDLRFELCLVHSVLEASAIWKYDFTLHLIANCDHHDSFILIFPIRL